MKMWMLNANIKCKIEKLYLNYVRNKIWTRWHGIIRHYCIATDQIAVTFSVFCSEYFHFNSFQCCSQTLPIFPLLGVCSMNMKICLSWQCIVCRLHSRFFGHFHHKIVFHRCSVPCSVQSTCNNLTWFTFSFPCFHMPSFPLQFKLNILMLYI